MDELRISLRACLDDDERIARAALAEAPGLDGRWLPTTTRPSHMHEARWDPARVLADVDAKRRIIEAEQDRVIEEGPLPERMRDLVETDVIKLLAQPYAGRPGWRDEWRVAD